MGDLSCLAEGYVVPVDFEKTGLNSHEIICGTTGCGKSMSIAYPRLLHTNESSVVVPISKVAIKDKFERMFEERGYNVVTLDFAHPEKSKIGYDPLEYIHSEEDILNFASNVIRTVDSKEKRKDQDPYWSDSAVNILAAEVALVMLNAKDQGKKACFADVIELHRSLKVKDSVNLFSSNLDQLFAEANRQHPGNQASELWKTVSNLAMRTASCIISVLNSAIGNTFSSNVIEMTRKKKKISFKTLGTKKTALFIITSPMNKSMQNVVNIMYSDLFRELFETAEKNANNRLNVPVHIICDDFACGSKILNFDEYISIFRAAGISVSILIQSETQLASMYGETAATTIINNCDTYVYMGGMDLTTCKNISVRIDKPVQKILSMPLERVIVFRRGSEPVEARRYQILDDPEYQKLLYNKECDDGLVTDR